MTSRSFATPACHHGTYLASGDFYAGLRQICLGVLRQALNPQTALWDRQLRNRRWEATWGTEDLTSTSICLIGMHRAAVDPSEVGLEVSRTLEAAHGLYRRYRYFGAVGLLIWCNAVWDGPPLAELLEKLGLSPRLLEGLLSGLTTMEAAWLASGLLHECARQDMQAADLACRAVAELSKRYCAGTQTMTHASSTGPLAQRARRYVANFADQIYSAQAFSFADIVLDHSGAHRCSASLARHLVELQGPKGQWWWHYDSRDGRVAQAYPVYSVHQYGMAAMGLSAVAAGGGEKFANSSERSRRWLTSNELGLSMIDAEAGTIWRSIEYAGGSIARHRRHISSVLGWKDSNQELGVEALRLTYETRPYELAWCLYAGAIESGQDRRSHIV